MTFAKQSMVLIQGLHYIGFPISLRFSVAKITGIFMLSKRWRKEMIPPQIIIRDGAVPDHRAFQPSIS
jgi:hypothetical protein